MSQTVVSALTLALRDTGTADRTLQASSLVSSSDKCLGNCSGHGSCQDGQCLCLVQFSGGTCHDVNIGYYVAFGSIFVLLGLVAFIQLVLCIHYEYVKEDKRSLRQAFKVTVQKLLLVSVVCATAIRGAYFFTKWQVSDVVAYSLWSAYFPFIITGFSLIVCFWAEAFHISATPTKERQFLSKSSIFFIIFNIVQYLVLATELITPEVIDDEDTKALILRVCNGSFALLMIIVVIFFLIYGVEVYFKVRGAFRESESNLDTWQLHMSRLGLVAQATLQLITALFLISDVASDVWKDKLPVLSQNFYDIGFRLVEFGVALWFPCVLWNCGQPEELWVLNPRRIFRSFEFHKKQGAVVKENVPIRQDETSYSTFRVDSKLDCWICYDPDRGDAGSLIQPCVCKGDMAWVHHECLKKWLIESASPDTSPECRVCGQKYVLEASYWIPKGLRPRHWLQTFMAVLVIVGTPFAAFSICRAVTISSSYPQVLTIGLAVLTELVALRIFFTYASSFCQKASVATMRIKGEMAQTDHVPAPSDRPSEASCDVCIITNTTGTSPPQDMNLQCITPGTMSS